jgi:hypothetical protein
MIALTHDGRLLRIAACSHRLGWPHRYEFRKLVARMRANVAVDWTVSSGDAHERVTPHDVVLTVSARSAHAMSGLCGGIGRDETLSNPAYIAARGVALVTPC